MTLLLDIAEILQGFLTPTIGGIVAYIAWQQFKANKLKLALDRYDRRLRIYEEVVVFIGRLLTDFQPKLTDVSSFHRATAEADFLFGPDIPAYIAELTKKATDLYVADKEDGRFGDPTYDHAKTLATRRELESWFLQQPDVVVAKFKPYLSVS